MKNGDIVVVTDESYIQEITPDKLESVSINLCQRPWLYGYAKGLKHKIVSTNCKFPKECSYQPADCRNNTIICGTEGCIEGKFFAVCDRFLRLTPQKHQLVIDGKTIMISDESYQALKKSLQ